MKEFDSRNNHKKYPPGDIRRLTDIADALTAVGEKHKKDNSPLGVAIRSQGQPILEIKKEVEQYIQTTLSQISEEIDQILEEVEDEVPKPRDAWNTGYNAGLRQAKSLIQKHIDE